MKTFLIWVFSLVIILAIAGYVFYRFYLPDVVADAITSSEALPDFLPQEVKNKIAPYKEAVNKSADQVIQELHERNIPVSVVVTAIQQVEEEHVQAAVADLSAEEIKTSDQAFDIIKKHFPADFDVEALREPFNENVSTGMIRKAIRGFNANQRAEIDLEMAKEIATKVLLQKDSEFELIQNSKLRNQN